ncbi:MAG: Holliday junction resolvase RuvX [Gammaproteobacteria bacterium]|nr:Holliday junction resolvase RuvX [Gammaproteobacteria bacterium]
MPKPKTAETPVATIIAFDFGLRRIGVAVGQTVTGSASPLGVVSNGSSGPDHDRIAALLKEWRPDKLVVGMPFHVDGRPGDMEKPIHAFIDELRRYKIAVTTVDERYTSLEAEEALRLARQSGSRGRIRKEDIDVAAAVLIAERYLARHRSEPVVREIHPSE